MENLETTYNHKGRDYMDLVPDRLSIEEISNCVKASECGAISLFIGTTRDNFNGLKVSMYLDITQNLWFFPAISNFNIFI